jgi:hypothetical protein
MTRQEYTKYTGTAYMSQYRRAQDAVRLSINEHNLGKAKIIILENGNYGVCQNNLANKFIKAGYGEYALGFKDLA